MDSQQENYIQDGSQVKEQHTSYHHSYQIIYAAAINNGTETPKMTKLFVIPGHGAGDPGATGYGYNEAERVRALATKLKEYGGDNVLLADFNRNYYADNGISTLNIPKDYQILELHMDSATASAKGGHVIIKSGFTPDKYDTALANFITSYFPGRSNKIIGRSDLANPNRAANKGYSYRLLETCFISNQNDINKFNNNLDEIAKGILKSFDITPIDNTPQPPIHIINHNCQIWEYNDTDAQKWWIRWINDNTIALRNVSSWNWLSLPNSNQEPCQAEVWEGTKENKDPRDPQILILEQINEKNNTYKIHPKQAQHLSLDVDGASKKSGTKVQWYYNNNSKAQEWYLYKNDDNTYLIISTCSFLPLDVENGGI